jgi:hypothetical protein
MSGTFRHFLTQFQQKTPLLETLTWQQQRSHAQVCSGGHFASVLLLPVPVPVPVPVLVPVLVVVSAAGVLVDILMV